MFGSQLVDLLFLRDMDGNHQCITPVVDDVPHCGLTTLLGRVGDHDWGAFLCKQIGYSRPMPEPPPVTIATLSFNRIAYPLNTRVRFRFLSGCKRQSSL
jgi:hypothetical protein